MARDIESSNLIFDLDDSTGLINAIIWQINPEKYKEYNKGDIVDIVGTVRESRETMSISIEIMRKVKEPNYVLLKNAEIIKKIRFGKIELIPDTKEEDFGRDEIPFNEHFKGGGLKKVDDIKEKIYSIIEAHSSEDNGISLEKLKEKVQITEEDLKNIIEDLKMESRIYSSEKDFYQSY
jgi:DNA replicative helicase MCM subunit Mcm2 (Cdc46/Mcm family)